MSDLTGNDKSSSDENDIPEVEAEIVDDGEALAATDQDHAVDETPDEATPVDAEAADNSDTKAISPGVMLFAAFGVAALLIFGVWRFSGGNDAPNPSPEFAGTPQANETAVDDAARSAEAAAPTTAELPADDAPEDIAAAIGEAGEGLESKITNKTEEAKSFAENSGSLGSSGVFLPPVSGDGSTDLDAKVSTKDLGTTVKEKLAALEGTSQERAQEVLEDAEDITGFEVEPDDAAAAALDASDLDAAEIAEAVSEQADELGLDAEDAAASQTVIADAEDVAVDVGETELTPETETLVTQDDETAPVAVAAATEGSSDDVGDDIPADVEAVAEDSGAAALAASVDVASETQRATQQAIEEQAQLLSAEIDALKSALDTQSEEFAGVLSVEQERNAALETQIETLREEMETLTTAQQSEVRDEILALKEQFDAYQQANPAEQTDQRNALLTLSALDDAISDGRPFARELNLANTHFGGAAALRDLEKFAETGVPTVRELQDGFPSVAREVLAAAGASNADGFVGKLSARLQGLVSVRPAAPIEGDTPRAVISRVEAAVEEGRLTKALSELSLFSDDVLVSVDGWTSGAGETSLAQQALDELRARYDAAGYN